MRFAALLAAAWPLLAHDPVTTKLTFTAEIVRIVHRRCAECHRAGGSAPMSLLAYAEARPWAKAIKEEVLERRMPPWGAVKGFGDFADDRGLTQEEIHTIADWVEGGAPEGDPKYLPEFQPPADTREATLASRIAVKGSLRLPSARTLLSIRPEGVAEKVSFQVVARLPDGRVEPLLWIYRFQQKFARSYTYREPVRLPAGSVIQVVPPQAAAQVEFMTGLDPRTGGVDQPAPRNRRQH
jgi:hypothetical protein